MDIFKTVFAGETLVGSLIGSAIMVVLLIVIIILFYNEKYFAAGILSLIVLGIGWFVYKAMPL